MERNGEVKKLVADISNAAGEQSRGISQLNDAVSNMDKVTQMNASSSEESASAAEELNGQATELRTMVEQFKLTVNGKRTTRAEFVPKETGSKLNVNCGKSGADAKERKTAKA
jgi:hypothetical protein